MPVILGISAYYHDSAAALMVNGVMVAAAQEERFNRQKHTAVFPSAAIRYCLQEAGINLRNIDAVVFYDKPLLKFERLLETYYAFAPRGLRSFLKAMPVWMNEKLFLKRLIRKELKTLGDIDFGYTKLLFSEHHVSHAAGAFFSSIFESAAVLTIDGVGEWATATIAHGKGNSLTILKELRFPHSLGLLYSAFTYYLGFEVNEGEYKVMGLAPYGDISHPSTQQYITGIREQLTDIADDGSIRLNQAYFNYATGLTMTRDHAWQKLFGIARRQSESAIEQAHCNMALAIQTVTEEVVKKMALEAKRVTGEKNLCMAGGVALNCVANGKLQASGIFEAIFVQPAAGDAGAAAGAALAVHHLFYGEPRNTATDQLQHCYLGPAYTDDDILKSIRSTKAAYRFLESTETLWSETARLLARGKVVGWFQGRMEFGPRALGNRSILADARAEGMQTRLNRAIKKREGFRPFAPAVMAEDAARYFEMHTPSPYMLFVYPVKKEKCKELPGQYMQMDMEAKLKTPRSDIQAVTHVDFSARVQTVTQHQNPMFYGLLKAYKQQTGESLLINTSFNVRGEPPVCTPDDACRCFLQTEMDYLVMGHYLLERHKP